MIGLRMIRNISVCVLTVTLVLSPGRVRLSRADALAESPAKSPAIVIGFVGGFIRHDNIVHSEVQLAARLRKDYAGSAIVDTFENRNGEKAYREIISLLDANHDG